MDDFEEEDIILPADSDTEPLNANAPQDTPFLKVMNLRYALVGEVKLLDTMLESEKDAQKEYYDFVEMKIYNIDVAISIFKRLNLADAPPALKKNIETYLEQNVIKPNFAFDDHNIEKLIDLLHKNFLTNSRLDISNMNQTEVTSKQMQEDAKYKQSQNKDIQTLKTNIESYFSNAR